MATTGPNNPQLSKVAWVGRLRLGATRMRARVREEDLIKLADLLSEVGAPGDRIAEDTYIQSVALLLNRSRYGTIPLLRQALEKIPPGGLLRLAKAYKAWLKVTEGKARGFFHSDRVIETMLGLPAKDPTPYIQRLMKLGMVHLAQVFHPSSLERAKKDPALRGFFGVSPEYLERYPIKAVTE